MPASQIPAGKTWFDTLGKSFADVPINSEEQGIDTSSFLEAAESTATLFDLFGSMAFTPVKNDMIGNVTKVRQQQNAKPLQSDTLQNLCKAELATKSHKATEGLVWLVRGLDFTAQALRNDIQANSAVAPDAVKPTKELAESFRAAYKNTLAPHHSFMIKPVFSAAMSATPYRKDLYKSLTGESVSTSTAQASLEKWLSALEERLTILKTFLASKEAKW